MNDRYRVAVAQNGHKGIKTARLNVSVGQEYHEGNKMDAMCDWLNRNFDKIVINVCDTLQRHNIEASGIEPDRAYRMAKANGDQWLERNKTYIGKIKHAKIIRWHEWMRDPKWDHSTEMIGDLIHTDQNFCQLLDNVLSDFWEKRAPKNDSLKNKFFIHSRRYILEETVCSVVASQLDVVDVYPGTFLPLFDYLKSQGIPTIENMTRINFKRRKQVKFG